MDACTVVISTNQREARVAAVQSSARYSWRNRATPNVPAGRGQDNVTRYTFSALVTIPLATRRTNPLSKSISKGNTPHSGGATPCTDLQGWPFALLSEKSGISPSMVVFPRQLRRGFFLAAFWQQCAARRKQFSSCETPPSFPAGVYPRVCRAFLRAHPCGAFREGRFPYPSFASSYWVSRPSGRAFTRLRSMLIRILNAKPFAVTGLRNPRVSMLGRRTPVNS